MFRAFFVSAAGFLLSLSALAQTYNLDCVPQQPANLPFFSAEVHGTVVIEEENVTGTLNMVLVRNTVGQEPVVTELNDVAVQGSYSMVGNIEVIDIKGTDTTPADLVSYIKLAVTPNGDKRTLSNGGFVRTTYGFYRPHHCTLN